jgi:hypothetical protein
MIYARVSEKVHGAFVSDVIVKRHLGARKEADGHLSFADGGETTGD